MGRFILVTTMTLLIIACSPKVGSEAWCEKMNNTPASEWTLKEGQQYTKACVLGIKE